MRTQLQRLISTADSDQRPICDVKVALELITCEAVRAAEDVLRAAEEDAQAEKDIAKFEEEAAIAEAAQLDDSSRSSIELLEALNLEGLHSLSLLYSPDCSDEDISNVQHFAPSGNVSPTLNKLPDTSISPSQPQTCITASPSVESWEFSSPNRANLYPVCSPDPYSNEHIHPMKDVVQVSTTQSLETRMASIKVPLPSLSALTTTTQTHAGKMDHQDVRAGPSKGRPIPGSTEDDSRKVLTCSQWMMLTPASGTEPNITVQESSSANLKGQESCSRVAPESSWLSGLAQVAAASLVASFLGATSSSTPVDQILCADEDDANAFTSLSTALSELPSAHERSKTPERDACEEEKVDTVTIPDSEYLTSYTEFWYHLFCCIYTGLPESAVHSHSSEAGCLTHTPEVSEFLQAIDICERLRLWDGLEQYLTSKRFLQVCTVNEQTSVRWL